MKCLIFFAWLLVPLFPTLADETIVEDTIYLTVNDSSKYSEKDYVLTIALPKKYNRDSKKEWKEIKNQLDKMVLEVEVGKITLEYINQTIVKDKNGAFLKVSLANLLAQYYATTIPWQKVTKEKIIMIKNKGKNWRLIKP